MMRVLVLGGAGYIGSHCCKALAASGFEPVVFDNLTTGHRSFVRWGPLFEGDVRDQDRLYSVMAEVRPMAVMHFAALALVGQSVGDPGSYYDVNLVGTLRLLEAMRQNGTECLVFSSTCAVYGEPDSVPLTENSACRPVNPYGASKLACERMMDDFGAAYGIRSVRLRYFNAAGADPDCEVGECHDPETHLVPLVIDAALGRRPKLDMFGSDYPTPDGTAIRDYVHVSDLASAHIASLNHLLDGGETQAMNLGTGKGASVAEVVSEVEAVTGLAVPRREAPRRAGDPAQLVADPAKARSLIGWEATKDLSAIVRDAYEWHRGQNAGSGTAAQ
jgi:UDP-glucose-4-epimerase GalE